MMPPGVEVLVGLSRQAPFGLVLMLGWGGVQVELPCRGLSFAAGEQSPEELALEMKARPVEIRKVQEAVREFLRLVLKLLRAAHSKSALLTDYSDFDEAPISATISSSCRLTSGAIAMTC